MRSGTHLRLALGILLAAALAGCSRSSLLPDATYASHMIPIYPHATLADEMGSRSFGDEPGESWDGKSWWLRSKDSPDRIVAFYQSRLKGWERETDETGAIVFRTVPPHAEDGEEVWVKITGDGGIEIGESVKSSKRAHPTS